VYETISFRCIARCMAHASILSPSRSQCDSAGGITYLHNICFLGCEVEVRGNGSGDMIYGYGYEDGYGL